MISITNPLLSRSNLYQKKIALANKCDSRQPVIYMFQVFFETLEARSCWFCQRLHCFVLRNRSFQITVRQFITSCRHDQNLQPIAQTKTFP